MMMRSNGNKIIMRLSENARSLGGRALSEKNLCAGCTTGYGLWATSRMIFRLQVYWLISPIYLAGTFKKLAAICHFQVAAI